MCKTVKWRDFIDLLQQGNTNEPNAYADELTRKRHDFYEECRFNYRNNEKYFFSMASDLKLKLTELREEQFTKEEIKAINLPPLEALKILNNNRVFLVLKCQYHNYDLAIEYLKRYFSGFEPKETTKTKKTNSESVKLPDYQSFTAKIDPLSLEDAWIRMMELNLITNETELESFKRVFTGKTPLNRIEWLGGPGQLRYFIRKLNGNGVYKVKAFWETTVYCFSNNGKSFAIDQLRKGKDPKETHAVDQVLKIFNT